jgi:glycosyltransferase involved in cell wall biosynthesis
VADKVGAARELVEAEFDWAVIARRFADLVGRIAEDGEHGK